MNSKRTLFDVEPFIKNLIKLDIVHDGEPTSSLDYGLNLISLSENEIKM